MSQKYEMAILKPFLVIFCYLHKYLSQNLGADGHYKRLNVSKSQLDQNLWHKSQIVLTSVFFNYGRKKVENLSFKNGHFKSISDNFFGNYINIFHKTEIQTVILRCLVRKKLNGIKCYDMILIKIFILYAWKCIISGLVCRCDFWHLRRKPALVFSKWLFFQNSLRLSWDT